MRLLLLPAALPVLLTMFLAVALPARAFSQDFRLFSPEIESSQIAPDWMVNDAYGCTGANRSPELKWENAPAGTQSFALTLFDPDAPREGGWLHWVVFNIRGDVSRLPGDAGRADGGLLPIGALSLPGSFGKPGYGGPCPPVGDMPHRYIFTLYAMRDRTIDYPLSAMGQSTVNWLADHAIGQASMMVLYGREK